MNMPIIVRLATKADLSNRSAAVALRDFEPLMTAVGQTRSFGDVGSVSGLPEADMVGGFMSTRPRSFDSEFASECA